MSGRKKIVMTKAVRERLQKDIAPMRYKFYGNAVWDRPKFQLEAHPLNDK